MSISKALVAALAILAAAPALAGPRGYGYYRPAYEPASSDNSLRLEIGGASISSPGLFCPNGQAGACVQDLPFDWQALAVGGELDIGLGRGSPVALSIGAREIAARMESGNPSIFEPYVGLTFRFLRYQPVQPRFSVGAAFMLGNDSSTGAALRIGGGLSFFATAPVGLAIDAMADFGRFGGYGVSQVQLTAGPEFHF
jgi:hypothetical protein